MPREDRSTPMQERHCHSLLLNLAKCRGSLCQSISTVDPVLRWHRSFVSQPLSSEDLTTADEEDDGWARIGNEEDEAFSRIGDRASKDVGLRALLGVNSVVVRESRSSRV